MAEFSKKSLEKIEKAHPELQRLFFEVIKHFDCTILHTHRSQSEQFELYKKGRTIINGEWIVTGAIVTKLDGFEKKSKHNFNPSLAIDVCPYPINFKDRERITLFAGYVLGISKILDMKIVWGGDWNGDTEVKDNKFDDLLHFELRA